MTLAQRTVGKHFVDPKLPPPSPWMGQKRFPPTQKRFRRFVRLKKTTSCGTHEVRTHSSSLDKPAMSATPNYFFEKSPQWGINFLAKNSVLFKQKRYQNVFVQKTPPNAANSTGPGNAVRPGNTRGDPGPPLPGNQFELGGGGSRPPRPPLPGPGGGALGQPCVWGLFSEGTGSG